MNHNPLPINYHPIKGFLREYAAKKSVWCETVAKTQRKKALYDNAVKTNLSLPFLGRKAMQTQRFFKNLCLKVPVVWQTRFARFALSGSALTLATTVTALVLYLFGQGHMTTVIVSHVAGQIHSATSPIQFLVDGTSTVVPNGDPGF